MNDLFVSIKASGPWAILQIAGEIDLNTAPKLKEAIVGSMKDGFRRIALDLTNVGFLDSTGLAAMVSGIKRANEAGGGLVLINPNEHIQRILSITDLEKIFPVFSNAESLPTSMTAQEARS